jgi:DNA polymerase-1
VKALLVDGNNLLMRALFATKKSGMTAHGVPTGPLHVFVTSLSRHVREERPTHLAVAWDSAGRGMRGEIDGGYKANRLPAPTDELELKESAFALTKEFCSLAGVFQTGYAEGGVEADDIIGAWWRQWVSDPVMTVHQGTMVILSSDKDLLQLVDRPGVAQVRLSSANTPTDRWNAVTVEGHYGVPAHAVPALLAIAGDTADNIIGVKGIGPKKAAKALQDHGLDFEATIAARWPEEAQHLRENYRLTNLRTAWPHERVPPPGPVPEMSLTAPEDALWAPLVKFLAQYELDGIRQRLKAAELWSDDEPPRRLGGSLKTG